MARKSARLGEKLRFIRLSLDLSQNGILRRLGLDDELTQAEWSAYERGVRIPSLPVLLMIADLAGVWMDVIDITVCTCIGTVSCDTHRP